VKHYIEEFCMYVVINFIFFVIWFAKGMLCDKNLSQADTDFSLPSIGICFMMTCCYVKLD
jgi:hypothetical protein